ncbi:adenylate/guanylate cyclase domain-containing protein [candidate division WOR-3 bacterium]|nr:adenylate/guanylate cyclase domain-containing protein [candidate division WOR-3 bacterium]
MKVSIRFKISGLLVVLVFLLMAGTGFAIISLVRDSFLEEIKLRGIILARNIAFSAEDPLMEADDLTLTTLTRDALRHTGSAYAYILDTSGVASASPAVLLEAGTKEDSIRLAKEKWHETILSEISISPGQEYEGMIVAVPEWVKESYREAYAIGESGLQRPAWKEIYEVAVPVMLGGQKKIGEVHVGIDLTHLQRASRRIQMVVGGIALVGIIIGILGAFGLGTLLIRPLRALVKGVAEIARGNFDYRIKKSTNDEIGDLTSAFNVMAKDLRDKVLIEDAFKRYVSHQVADEILKDPDVFAKSLKGEKRPVTVFFGDIRGFTTISEQLPPEEVVAFLNFYLTEMTSIIFRNEGTIDKFMGDCIMAIFGAPVMHGDDVYKSVKSAVEIQKKVEDMNMQRILEGKRDIHVGIGINYGEAVVGNIGSTQRLEYTVIGDSVNTAARLQTLAKPGEVVVSDSVYHEVKGFFDFIPMEPVTVKGKAKALTVWKIKLPINTIETVRVQASPPSQPYTQPKPESKGPENLGTPSYQPE